jgi:hypothetical protein
MIRWMRARAVFGFGLLFFTACSSGESLSQGSERPQPSAYSSGEAQVELTGDLEQSLDLTLASDRDPSYEDGRVSLEWEHANGNFMSIRATPKDGEADARSEETPLLVSFYANEQSFSPAATGTCAASFDQLEPDAINGTLTCSNLRLPEGTGFGTVSAEGSFSAAA